MNIDPDAFITEFFGPGNEALPGGDLDGPRGHRVQLYLAPLLAGVRRAMILPRSYSGGRTDAYVVAWDPAEAGQMRRLIEAFVGHSVVPFDGRLSRLHDDDPVEAAIIRLVGRNTTYVLRADARPAAQQALWRRLVILRDLLNSRPGRARSIPRPVGRVLAELRAAIASGAARTSADLIEELTRIGGVSPINLAYLRAHRLGHLGRSGELLRMPDLDDIVASRPPMAVAEAILSAWVQVEVDVIDLDSPSAVERAVAAAAPAVARLVPLGSRIELHDPAVRLAAALVCLASRDPVLARRLVSVDGLPSEVGAAVAALVPSQTNEALGRSEPARPPEPATPYEDPPRSWTEWVQRLGANVPNAAVLGPDRAGWPQPVAEDEALATALGEVSDTRADSAWGVVGPFLEADAFGDPAWRSAQEFLLQAATYNRWAPGDLTSVQALLEIFTRGAPAAPIYADVMDLVGDTVPRWASIANVERTLDIVDVLARAGCPDNEARVRFGALALEPLHRGRWRLDAAQLWLARRIGAEVGLDWDWTSGEDESFASPAPRLDHYASLTVLVYSLNPGALQRTADGLASLAPGLKIHRSSHKVGTDQLRDQTRSADAIAIATRCAKHSATGFIRQNARSGAVIREAEGAGSATLLRAAIAALDDFRAELVMRRPA